MSNDVIFCEFYLYLKYTCNFKTWYKASFRSSAFACMHARDLRTSAGTSQKYVKFPPRQVGHRCTSRCLNKHSLGEGTPLWKEVCHFSRGKFHVIIPTNWGDILVCWGECVMSAFIWDHMHKNADGRSTSDFLKSCDMTSYRQHFWRFDPRTHYVMRGNATHAWSETRLLRVSLGTQWWCQFGGVTFTVEQEVLHVVAEGSVHVATLVVAGQAAAVEWRDGYSPVKPLGLQLPAAIRTTVTSSH